MILAATFSYSYQDHIYSSPEYFLVTDLLEKKKHVMMIMKTHEKLTPLKVSINYVHSRPVE